MSGGAGGQDGVAMSVSGGSIFTDVESEGGAVAMSAVCLNGQYEMLGK